MTLLDDVKQRVDIVEVVSRYVQLQPAGRNMKAPCPFHTERTPSFVVFPESQTWRCFGACATGGDAIGFVMKREDLSFAEALRRLAKDVGVALPTPTATPAASNPLITVNKAAAEFYTRYLLAAPEAAEMRAYVQKRGLTNDTITAWAIGYAPTEPDRLHQHLLGRGFNADVMVNAGLVLRGDDGRTRDMFRGRLMFSIADASGNIVGFSGRSMDGSNPKYMNTTKTSLFDKGSILYGFHRAADAIRASGEVVIVEGYMDVVMPHQEGFRNVVASMGTALTQQQVALLEGLAKTVVLALDPDAAGQEAMYRSLDTSWRIFQRPPSGQTGGRNVTFRQRGIELKVAQLPDGKDPDEIVLESPDAWKRHIANAASVLDFLFLNMPKRHDLKTAEGRMELAQKLGGLIVTLEPGAQGRYMAQLSAIVGVDQRTLDQVLGVSRQALLRQAGVRPPQRVLAAPGAMPFRGAPGNSLERHTLGLLLKTPELRDAAAGLAPDHFRNAENREVFIAWWQGATLGKLKSSLDPLLLPHLETLLDASAIRASLSTSRTDLAECVYRLQQRLLQEKKHQEGGNYIKQSEEASAEGVQTGVPPEALAVNKEMVELFKERHERSNAWRKGLRTT